MTWGLDEMCTQFLSASLLKNVKITSPSFLKPTSNPLQPHPRRKPSMDMQAEPKVKIDLDITCKICGQVALACAISQRRKKCRTV